MLRTLSVLWWWQTVLQIHISHRIIDYVTGHPGGSVCPDIHLSFPLFLICSDICCFLFDHTKTGAGTNVYCSLRPRDDYFDCQRIVKNAYCDFSDVFFHQTSDPKRKSSSFTAINATASLTFKKLEAANVLAVVYMFSVGGTGWNKWQLIFFRSTKDYQTDRCILCNYTTVILRQTIFWPKKMNIPI